MCSLTDSVKKQPLAGISSLVLGIVNVLISGAIFWALWQYLNHLNGGMLPLQVAVMNAGSSIEKITKPLGLVAGIIGLCQKKRAKQAAKWGVFTNGLSILWSLAFYGGLII